MEYSGYKPGYIYVLRSGPYYKVGYADDVPQRMKTINNAVGPDLPEPPTVLYTFPTRSKLIAERSMHDFLRQSRVKGEWFKLTSRQLKILELLADGYSIDQFVTMLHRLPSDVVLFSADHIAFFKQFDLIFPATQAEEDITSENLERYIEEEKARRSRKQRAERYQDMITKLLKEMSVDDLEWLYETIMLRGVHPEDDG